MKQISLSILLLSLGLTQGIQAVPGWVRAVNDKLGMIAPLVFWSDRVHMLKPETVECVRTIAQEMGFKRLPAMYGVRNLNNHAMHLTGLILDEAEFESFTPDEKRMVIGHELTHAQENHNIWKGLCTGMVLYMIQLGYKKVAQNVRDRPQVQKVRARFNAWLEDRHPTLYSLYRKRWAQDMLESGTNLLITLPIAYIPISAFSRYLERRADGQAARKLNAAQGGITFFKKFVDGNQAKKSGISWMMGKIKALYNSHPSAQERIEYFQKA